MIVVMTIVYIISWSPWYISNTVALFFNYLSHSNYFFTFLLLHLIGFLNSACNPIIYFFMSERIRNGIHRLARQIFCCTNTAPPGLQLRLNDYSSASLHTTQTGQYSHIVHNNLGTSNPLSSTYSSTRSKLTPLNSSSRTENHV